MKKLVDRLIECPILDLDMEKSCEEHLKEISLSLVEIQKCLKLLSDGGEDGRSKGKWKKVTKRQRILSFLEENSSESFRIDSLAEKLGASETYIHVNIKSFLKEDKVKRVSKGVYQWAEGEPEEEVLIAENDFSILN